MRTWDKYESELVDKMQEEAHQAWLEEKATLLDFWVERVDLIVNEEGKAWIQRTINFIERAKD